MVRISFKKQRKIDLSNISLTGSIISVKNNSVVDFESSLERDYIYLLEYETNIKSYYEQPIKISYFDNDKAKIYIPDFFVEYYNGLKSNVIEIKYKKDLEENKEKYQKKFNAASVFCKKNNLNFIILTEEDIRTEILFNAKFLLYYQNPLMKINNGYVEQIYNTIKKFKQITARELIDETVIEEDRKPEFIYVLWHMVANHLLNYNKENKLTMSTVISLRN